MCDSDHEGELFNDVMIGGQRQRKDLVVFNGPCLQPPFFVSWHAFFNQVSHVLLLLFFLLAVPIMQLTSPMCEQYGILIILLFQRQAAI